MSNTFTAPIPKNCNAVAFAALALLSTVQRVERTNIARCEDLERIEREAQTWLYRRAAYQDRDRAIYRTGAAFEPQGGHLLDDIMLSGLDALGIHGMVLMIEVWTVQPSASLSECMRVLFASPHASAIREWGVWARRVWLAALYQKETLDFLKTKKGRDPKQAWRRLCPTRKQLFLIEEIARQYQEEIPVFETRGEAFEWILGKGGNPRHWHSPVPPALPRTLLFT